MPHDDTEWRPVISEDIIPKAYTHCKDKGDQETCLHTTAGAKAVPANGGHDAPVPRDARNVAALPEGSQLNPIRTLKNGPDSAVKADRYECKFNNLFRSGVLPSGLVLYRKV